MMKIIFTFNKLLLFLCASMYLGTGWSLLLFSAPIVPELTIDNYYLQFVPQVQAATDFFTPMTMVMIVCCVVFIVEEWKSAKKWYPIVILVLVVLATLLTMYVIFPYNDQMAAGIKDQELLQKVLHKWINLCSVRLSLWTLQWLTMAVYFFQIALKTKSEYE